MIKIKLQNSSLFTTIPYSPMVEPLIQEFDILTNIITKQTNFMKIQRRNRQGYTLLQQDASSVTTKEDWLEFQKFKDPIEYGLNN